jgi:hypothetical protein
MKIKVISTLALFLVSASSNAAVFIVSNVIGGVASTDALFQNTPESGGALLNGGIVTLGYFGSNAYVPSGNLLNISTTISDFSVVASGIAGTPSADLGGSFAGFVQAAGVTSSPATITGANALIGRALYVFVGNGATLSSSTAWGLKRVNFIGDDVPNDITYLANPFGGSAPVVGTIGSFVGNAGGQGSGTFATLQLAAAAVPEPSTMLLGLIGVSSLLRRRRH